MVGVVDFLPHGLSSVYLFYDPRFDFLPPGRVSAMYEIALTEAVRRVVPSFEFYFMGFYIHTCPKMRYKAEYAPSEVLCPVGYNWWKIHEVYVHRPLFLFSRCVYSVHNRNVKSILIVSFFFSLLYCVYPFLASLPMIEENPAACLDPDCRSEDNQDSDAPPSVCASFCIGS